MRSVIITFAVLDHPQKSPKQGVCQEFWLFRNIQTLLSVWQMAEKDHHKPARCLEAEKPLPFIYGEPAPEYLNTPLEELDPYYQSQKVSLFLVKDFWNVLSVLNHLCLSDLWPLTCRHSLCLVKEKPSIGSMLIQPVTYWVPSTHWGRSPSRYSVPHIFYAVTVCSSLIGHWCWQMQLFFVSVWVFFFLFFCMSLEPLLHGGCTTLL